MDELGLLTAMVEVANQRAHLLEGYREQQARLELHQGPWSQDEEEERDGVGEGLEKKRR